MSAISKLQGLALGAGLLSGGCGYGMMGSSMTDSDLATQLLSVSPQGGATGVAATSDVVLGFNRPMMIGMEQYVVLHQGGVTGPALPMPCNWSDGQRTLTCRPSQPLTPASLYTIHLGGGMTDADGQRLGMGQFGMGMGGRWATRGMMGGRLDMMGSGWTHGNGSYGMAFEFTTR